MVTETEVLKCLSDAKTLEILSLIHQNKSLLLAELNITRKQYYARLRNLQICGLIHKVHGRYKLSSLGKVVFDWHATMKDIIFREYWKLKTIDMLSSSELPGSERAKLYQTLLDNEKLRQILTD